MLLTLVLLAGGCAGGMQEPEGSSEPVSGQELAVQMIWAELGADPRPVDIRWVQPWERNCPDDPEKFWTEAGCAYGHTSFDGTVVKVIAPRGNPSRLSTVVEILGHELCHVAYFDPHHTGPCPDGSTQWHPMAQAVHDAGF